MSTLELPERFELKVEAILDQGSAVIRRMLAKRHLRRIKLDALEHRRGDYRDVWDEAVSATNARIAVCGTSDQGEFERSGEATAQNLIREVDIRPRDIVLEIGCGTGRVGVRVAPHCDHWIGAEVSRRMLDYAQQTLKGTSNVSFLELNGYDLAGASNDSIDVIYCSGVFMHLDEWDRYRYVVEAYRVLRPGGRFYFDSVNLLGDEGWRLFSDLCRLDPASRPPNVSKSSTSEELRTYAEHGGFIDIRVLAGPLWLSVIVTKPLPATQTEMAAGKQT
ncbi:MAG: class I SAM-dependent methyltransferase [Acidimicrobiia bacterium]